MVVIRDKNYTKKIGEDSIETIPFGVGAKNFHSGKFLIMPMLLVWEPQFESHCCSETN